MAATALVLGHGSPGPALAVLAGGLLVSLSYWTLKRSVTGLADAMSRGDASTIDGQRPARTQSRVGFTLTRLVLRYALLAFLAYVMIARLRLHPLGLLAGASSVVAAVSIEAARLLMKKS